MDEIARDGARRLGERLDEDPAAVYWTSTGVLTDGGLLRRRRRRDQGVLHPGQSTTCCYDRLVLAIFAVRLGLVRRRAPELAIEHVFEGVEDKRTAFAELCARSGLLAPRRRRHPGPKIAARGLACASSNLPWMSRACVHLVTDCAGGSVLREVCETIMRAQGTWDDALEPYL